LLADREQLLRGEPDRVGLGADEVGARLELVGRKRRGDGVGEAVRPAVAALAGEGGKLVVAGLFERFRGRPTLEQTQKGRRAEIVAGDLKRRWEGGDQVLAEPVQLPPRTGRRGASAGRRRSTSSASRTSARRRGTDASC
jgi:hypothetical protein